MIILFKKKTFVITSAAVLLAGCLAQFVAVAAIAQSGRPNLVPKTGSYEQAVQLSYDSITKEVSGYIKMHVNSMDDPRKIYRSCAVLFIGKINGTNTCKVDFYNSPEIERVTSGEMVFTPDKITLTANSGEGYCNDILNLTAGLEWEFTKTRPYIGCRAVNKTTAYIYSSPVDSAKTKMYLVQGDMVMILGVKGDWIRIEYIGKKIIDGWIRKEDLSPGFRRSGGGGVSQKPTTSGILLDPDYRGTVKLYTAPHPAKRVDNFMVTSCQKVADGFQYSNDILQYQRITYTNRISRQTSPLKKCSICRNDGRSRSMGRSLRMMAEYTG